MGCFLCLDAAGVVVELEHHRLALTCLVFAQAEMPQQRNDGSWLLAMARCKATEVHSLVLATSD